MRKFYVLLIGMLSVSVCVQAHTETVVGAPRILQQQTITGQVVDDTNSPIPGVNIMVKGTTQGTVTNENGHYTLNVASGNAVLVVSFIGFATQEVNVGGRSVVNISLVADIQSLDEVVITALGVEKSSKKLGYAITTVKNDDLINGRTTNVMESLQGKVAGLNISPPAAGAGASIQIRLRGQTGFAGGNNAPLIVINGLPMDQGARGANGNGPIGGRDLGDNLQNVNPEDIESMTVLKGSTAAALYGSRASNGAIIITTKSGKRDQGLGIEFNTSLTTNHALNFLDEIMQYEYGQGTGGVRPQDIGQAQSNGQFSFGERYDGVPTINFDGKMRPYKAYKDRLFDFLQTGYNLTNSIAFSGGSDKGSFRVSYTDTKARGIQPTNEYTKKVFNVGLNHDLSSKLKLQVNLNYASEHNFNPPQIGTQGEGAINFILRSANSIPLSAYKESAVNPETGAEFPTSSFLGTMNNPYYQIQKKQFFNDRRNRLLGTATLRYQITKWLYAQGRINFDRADNFIDFNTLNGAGAATLIDNRGNYRGSYEVQNGLSTDINADYLIGLAKEFGKFSVDASIGGNTWRAKSQRNQQYARSFVVPDLYTLRNGTITWQNETDAGLQGYPPFSYAESRVNSLYGWAEIGYDNILFLNFTGRNDWFSYLSPKYGNDIFYPSVSGSFVFSELLPEASWLSYGKLRGSWAQSGRATGVGPYDGLLTYSIGSPFNGQPLGSISGSAAPNPAVVPFLVTEKEIGLEARLFNNRVLVDLGVFDKVSEDQIIDRNISDASGYLTSKENRAALRNRGFESLIEVTPVQNNDFKWTTSWNNAYLATKVLDVGTESGTMVLIYFNGTGNEFLGELRYTEGLSMNQLYTRTYRRNDNGQIVVDNNGRLLATDSNTPGAEHTNGFLPVGSSIPKHVGGWNNTFTYKNFSLGVNFDYKFGGTMLSSTHINLLRQGHSKLSLEGRREGETGITFPAVYEESGLPNTSVVTNLQSFYADYRNLQIGDPFTFKSDYIKLRTLSLSYNFTSLIRDRAAGKYIKGASITAACRNVAILYKDIPGLDPESMQSSGDFRAGYENSALPTTRNFSLSINARF